MDKDNSFRSKALSHIPPDLIRAMEQKAEITPMDMEALRNSIELFRFKLCISINGSVSETHPSYLILRRGILLSAVLTFR